MTTLWGALDAVTRPESGLVFIDRRERETLLPWVTLREQARSVAASLRERGVQPGERVALVFRTEPDFFRAFFGCLYAGAVPTPLYPPVRLGRLEQYHERTATMMKSADVVLVLTSPSIRKLLGRAVQGAAPRLGCITLDQLKPSKPTASVPPESHLALVQFSSGTTNTPKPVALSHRALLVQGEVILNQLKEAFPDQAEVISGVSWLPLYHDMGLIGCVIPALLHQANLALIRPEDFIGRPALWLRALSRHKAIISPAPNFAYGLCAQRIRDADLEGVDLSHWRVALNGAEAVQEHTVRAFTDRFSPFGFREEAMTPVYGLSEAALAVCFSDFRSRSLPREGSDGQPQISLGPALPGFGVEIRDEDGAPVPAGLEGHVWVKGPSLMEGYLNQPEATEKVLVDGWLNTGDIGCLIDNELAVIGRAKDILILNGRNYAPAPIEGSIVDLPGLRAGCVAAISTRHGDSERLIVLVEHTAKATKGDIEGLPALCARIILEEHGLQAECLALEPGTLPRTSSGKIRRGAARTQLEQGTLLPPESMGPLKVLGALWESRRSMPRAK